MKRTFILFIILGLCQCAWAGNLQRINDKSMAVFLKIMPAYNQTLEKYSAAETFSAEGFNEELGSLFARFDVTPPEFSSFLQKVASGYAGLSDPTVPVDLTPAEKNALEKYQTQLRHLFE